MAEERAASVDVERTKMSARCKAPRVTNPDQRRAFLKQLGEVLYKITARMDGHASMLDSLCMKILGSGVHQT